MKKVKIFLASSKELKEDRNLFEIEIYRKCKAWLDKEIFLYLDIWEDMSARMSVTGSQSEYNKYVQSSDLFVFLAFNKVGMYTEEEFEKAFGAFQSDKKPFIFTYFRETDSLDESLARFKEKLRGLGHYYSPYKDSNDLWNQFNKELERLEEAKFEKNEHDKGVANSTITGEKNINIQGSHNQTTVQTGDTVNQQAEKIYNIEQIDTAKFD